MDKMLLFSIAGNVILGWIALSYMLKDVRSKKWDDKNG